MPTEFAVVRAVPDPASIQPQPAPLPARPTYGGLMRPVAKPAEVLSAQNETRALIQGALEPNRDYGVIPGTKKPTLLKPGAERILSAFGCYADPQVVEAEIDHDREIEWTKKGRNGPYGGTAQGVYRYVVRAIIVHRESGATVGAGVGSCSSLESKYIDRPRDLENTVLKMAKKRAVIDAVLSTFGLSDQFTQDVEDMQEERAPEEQDAPASPEQRELVEMLLKSHHMKDSERARSREILAQASRTAASGLIDNIKAEIKRREDAEKAAKPAPVQPERVVVPAGAMQGPIPERFVDSPDLYSDEEREAGGREPGSDDEEQPELIREEPAKAGRKRSAQEMGR